MLMFLTISFILRRIFFSISLALTQDAGFDRLHDFILAFCGFAIAIAACNVPRLSVFQFFLLICSPHTAERERHSAGSRAEPWSTDSHLPLFFKGLCVFLASIRNV